MKIRINKKLLMVFTTFIAIVIVVMLVFPIYVIIISSFSPKTSVFQPFEFIPREITLKVYNDVLFGPMSRFVPRLVNSLIVSLLSLAITLILVIPSAYAFSRFKFVGRNSLLYGYFAFNQFAGGMGLAGLIALYAILNYFNLLNSLVILALIYASGGVPFNTWLLKTYFDTIPKDFDEAALVDGASYLDIMFKVLLPIAKPGIATVAVFTFMGSWSEFIIAQTILLSDENYTLPLELNQLLASPATNWNVFAATSLLYAIPVIVMYLFAQRYLQAGLAMGGVKR
jgi:arabinogalactan oligomer/maltooligosaccharide transport system permease protein